MKKLICSLIAISALFSSFAGELPVPKNNQTRYDIIEVEGHHYLVVATKTEGRIADCHGAGVSSAVSLQVIHSYGCPCMTNKIQKIEVVNANASTNTVQTASN